MKSAEVRALEAALTDRIRHRHSSVPSYAIPQVKRSDSTANGLTQCIIDFLTLEGWQAERVVVMGKPIEEAGGRIKWVRSQMSVGTADIHCTIAGRSVKVEVKAGRDRQSAEQKHYQQTVEAAGGLYYIARDFATFKNWYNMTFSR